MGRDMDPTSVKEVEAREEAVRSMVDFAASDKTRAIQPLVDALFQNVIPDEPPLFVVSDEACMFDVSLETAEELTRRMSEYYKTPISPDDLKTPLWQLLPNLERRRMGL